MGADSMIGICRAITAEWHLLVSSRARALPSELRGNTYRLLHIRFTLVRQWDVRKEEEEEFEKGQNQTGREAMLAMLLLRLSDVGQKPISASGTGCAGHRIVAPLPMYCRTSGPAW